MGGAASRAAATKTAKTAASAAPAAAQQNARRAVQNESSREAIVVSHLDTTTRDLNGASLVRNPNAPHKPVELEEMNLELLNDIRSFEGYEKVDFLEQSDAAFRDTASSYRARSSAPVSMPTDRTAAASAAFGSEVVEKIPGRVTNRQLRELLRLRYENPVAWTSESLAQRYELDAGVVASILASVGPPDVLEPRAASEFPLGVWFDLAQQQPRTVGSGNA